MICSSCNKKIDRADFAKITCSDCGYIFHSNCAKINKNDVEYMRANNVSFRCEKCVSQRRKSLHHSSSLNTDNNIIETGNTAVIATTSSAKNTQNILAPANLHHQQQQTEHEFGDVTLQMLYSEILSLKNMNIEYLNSIKELQDQNRDLRSKVLVLENKINKLEQDKLKNNVDIVGVPNASSTNALEITKKILCDALSMNITDDNIVNCFVKPTRQKPNTIDNSNATATISVELSSFDLKKTVISSKKANYNKLNAAIFDKNKKNKIYINDSMTGYFRALYSASRAVKREKNFKYVWFKNSNVLFRKSESSKIVVVRSFDDLNKIKNTEIELN